MNEALDNAKPGDRIKLDQIEDRHAVSITYAHIVSETHAEHGYSSLRRGGARRFKAFAPVGDLLASHEDDVPIGENKHFIIPARKVHAYDGSAGRDRFPRTVVEAERICETEAEPTPGSTGGAGVKLGVAVIRSAAMRDAAI